MQFNRANNKEWRHSRTVVGQRGGSMYMQLGCNVLLIADVFAAFVEWRVFEEHCFTLEHVFKHSPSLPVPLFTVFNLVWWVPLSPFYMGAHDLVSRICQPQEWSPSGSWLPIVEALDVSCTRPPFSDSVVNWKKWQNHTLNNYVFTIDPFSVSDFFFPVWTIIVNRNSALWAWLNWYVTYYILKLFNSSYCFVHPLNVQSSRLFL